MDFLIFRILLNTNETFIFTMHVIFRKVDSIDSFTVLLFIYMLYIVFFLQLQLRGIVLTLSYHAWRHSWHDTITAIKICYVGVWVIFMYENIYAQWRISWCIEYYYLLQWPTVTDDWDEMPLTDIDTSDTHFRYNYNAAPIKFMHTWRCGRHLLPSRISTAHT